MYIHVQIDQNKQANRDIYRHIYIHIYTCMYMCVYMYRRIVLIYVRLDFSRFRSLRLRWNEMHSRGGLLSKPPCQAPKTGSFRLLRLLSNIVDDRNPASCYVHSYIYTYIYIHMCTMLPELLYFDIRGL